MQAPDTLLVLDFVEFCYRAVAKPIQGSFHEFYEHHHLTFRLEAGKKHFAQTSIEFFP